MSSWFTIPLVTTSIVFNMAMMLMTGFIIYSSLIWPRALSNAQQDTIFVLGMIAIISGIGIAFFVIATLYTHRSRRH